MKTLNPILILIPIAMLVLVPAGGAESIQTIEQLEQDNSKTVERADGAQDAISSDARQILYEFLGVTERECESLVPADIKAYSVEFLIATVPDPADSGVVYAFDRYLQAIHRALEADQFVLDRFRLPWSIRSDKAGSGDRRQSDEPAKDRGDERPETRRDKQTASKPCDPMWSCRPGTLLFRHSVEPRLLMLFLVGETPTAGVHKAALVHALDQVASISGWKTSNSSKAKAIKCLQPARPETREVRLLAPSFSGSGTSLDLSISNWLEGFNDRPDSEVKRPEVRIISGSAAAIDRQSNSRLNWDKVFKATVNPYIQTRAAFVRYLKSLDPALQDGEIAFLAEGNTSYGNKSVSDSGGFLLIPFPLHISKIRSGYRDKTNVSLSPVDLTDHRQHTQLTDEEVGSRKDVVPLFSAIEKTSTELVLSDLLADLNQRRIRYVGLVATDMQDRLFLANEVRRHCPNATLFTFGSDLLYLDAQSNPDFLGCLVISPYPLFGNSQQWIYPFFGERKQLQFASHSSFGVYNAALALLGREELMVDYGSPFWLEKEGDGRKPALWISQVGRDALWPVALLNYDDRGYLFEPANRAASNSGLSVKLLHSETLIIALMVLVLISALPSFALLRMTRLSASASTSPPSPGIALLIELFGDAASTERQAKRRLYLLACSTGLLCLCLVVVGVLWVPALARGGIQGWGAQAIFAIVLVVSVASFSATLLIATKLLKERPQRLEPRSLLSLAPIVLGPFAALVFVCMFVYGIWRLDYSSALFFYLRATALGSGLSPLLPLFFVGIAGLLWVVSSLRRLRLAERLSVPGNEGSDEQLPLLCFQNDSFAGVPFLETRVQRMILCSSFKLPGWELVLLVTGFAFYRILIVQFVPTIEGRYFDWLFKFAFLFIYLLLSLAFLRFVCVWAAVRRLLTRLAWHPITAAYERLGKYTAGPPRISLTGGSRLVYATEFSVSQANSLVKTGLEIPDGESDLGERVARSRAELASLAGEASTTLTDALRADAERRWLSALKDGFGAENALARLSALVVQTIEPEWSSGQISGSGKRPAGKSQAWLELAEDFLAGRTVVFLNHIFMQLQNLIFFVIAGLILMLISATCYPFQPREVFLLFNWSIVLLMVGAVSLTFVQMERSKVLSLLSGSVPGRVTLNREFVMRILIYGLVPIVTLLSAQFPDVIRQILSWLSVVQGHQ